MARQWLSTRQPLRPLEAALRYQLRLEAQRITEQTEMSMIKAKQIEINRSDPVKLTQIRSLL